MKPSLLKLQKFFKLESERGYDNRAVMGGLSRMLEPWEAEARQDGLPEELIAAVLSRLRDYNRLSPSSRQEALQGLWSRIQAEVGASPIDQGQPPESPFCGLFFPCYFGKIRWGWAKIRAQLNHFFGSDVLGGNDGIAEFLEVDSRGFFNFR